MSGNRLFLTIQAMKNNKILTEALRYLSLGFSIIPVGRDKKPLIPWKKYQKEKATSEEIKEWIIRFPDMNIGAVTGAISGIVVVDVEKEGSTEGIAPTATVKTGGDGWHFYYKHPGRPISNSARLIAPLTDIRGDGGYVVLPPSIHSSGNTYKWSDSAPIEQGFSNLPDEVLKKIDAAGEKTEVLDVSQGSRNATATKYIGRVLRQLTSDLWDTAGWASLRDWNATHAKPPLPENELEMIFSSIKEREYKQRGDKDAPNSKQPPFAPCTLTDLYKEEFPPKRWVVQDLIPFGSITALTGDSNSYKTFLTQSMAGSIATGNSFLGHFPTTQGKVFIVDEENHRRQVQERFKELGIKATPNIILLSHAGVKIDQKEHVKKLCQLINKDGPVLVILDSLVRLHGGEENSATDMAKAFAGMKKLVASDRAVLFIHHHRKPKQFANNGSNHNIRGSSDILAAVDTHLAVTRKDAEIAITQTKMRLQPEMKPFKAALVPTNEGISFTYQGEDTSEEDRRKEIYDAIKTALSESTQPLTIANLAEETKISETRIRQAIKELLMEKDITVLDKRGEQGRRYYSLPESV